MNTYFILDMAHALYLLTVNNIPFTTNRGGAICCSDEYKEKFETCLKENGIDFDLL